MHTHAADSSADPVTGEFLVSEFAIQGMNCNNCARHVTEAIQGVAGVAGADVRLEEGRATVRWRPDALLDAGQIVAAVKKAGYDAVPVQEPSRHSEASGSSPMAAWKFTLIFGAALTLPLILGEWAFGLGT